MDAIDFARRQHEEILGLFDDYEEEDHPDEKQVVADAVATLLLSHMTVEEAVLFPAVAGQVAETAVQEAIEMHHITRRLVGELRLIDSSDSRFDARFRLLNRLFRDQVSQEEQWLLTTLATGLSRDALKTLGTGMEHLFARVRQGFAHPMFTLTSPELTH